MIWENLLFAIDPHEALGPEVTFYLLRKDGKMLSSRHLPTTTVCILQHNSNLLHTSHLPINSHGMNLQHDYEEYQDFYMDYEAFYDFSVYEDYINFYEDYCPHRILYLFVSSARTQSLFWSGFRTF